MLIKNKIKNKKNKISNIFKNIKTFKNILGF